MLSSSRSSCDGRINHFRITFRYLNAVHVLYITGDLAYVYEDVALNLGRILDERVRAVPSFSGPPPDLIYAVNPRDVCISPQEAGQLIQTITNQDGSDDRGPYCEVRYIRELKELDSHIGPLDIYNKVWVTRDIETAHALYSEHAKDGFFPEAAASPFPGRTEHVGDGQFEMKGTPGVGNENFGWTSCNDNCGTKNFRFLHQRYVTRIGNVVAIVYIFGSPNDSHAEQVSTYAESMRGRIH